MRELWKSLGRLLVSLQLTVVLLVMSIMLVFFATLDQVHLGVWGIQHKWFYTFVVTQPINGITVPVFPGGYIIGGLLLINLIGGHLFRFRFTWRKSGIQLAHFGLILLIFSQFITGLSQRESSVQFRVGETRYYSEDFRLNELAVIDTTDPKTDEVTAIPESLLVPDRDIQTPRLPFRLVTRAYYPNCNVLMRSQAPNAPASPATVGAGPDVVIMPQPITYKEDERNIPAAFVELIGPEGTLGTWLVTPWLQQAQGFSYDGRSWQLVMRSKRYYTGYGMKLLQLKNDIYPGTDIPKNFSSRVRIETADGKGDRDVLVYMNSPLRYGGFTYYQYQMNKADGLSVFQVVRNPSWLLPYIACSLVAIGLLIQFGLHLFGFIRKRAALG